MKVKQITFLVLLTTLCGCGRDYEVNAPADLSSVAGTWVLFSVPNAATNNFPTNQLSFSTLTLRTNKSEYSESFFKSEYFLLPLQTNAPKYGIPAQWIYSSGTGTWSFADEGSGGKHLWKVDLQTEKLGIQLILGKEKSGQTVLLYYPDPDYDEAVVFHHSSKGELK